MRSYLRWVASFYALILLMSGVLDAQPKAEVSIEVVLLQVAHDRTAQLVLTSSSLSQLLDVLIADDKTKIVDSPKLRASDGQKAIIRIGGDIPIAMQGLQRGAGIGVSPALSTKFTFADVGLDLIVTPQIHSPERVTLHLTLTAYDIVAHTSSKNLADIPLRTGDAIILGRFSEAGMQSETANTGSIAPLPGLINFPLLGNILIALTPHIVTEAAR